MARLLPIVICVALVAGGVVTAASRIGRLSDARLEQTRTAIPGSRTVHLEKRKYVVFNEAATQSLAKRSSFRIQLRSADDDLDIPLGGYSGNLELDTGGPASTAVATVDVPRDGVYVFSGQPDTDTRGASITLGKPTGRAVLTLVIAVVVTALAFVGLVVGIILAIVLPRRGGKRDSGGDVLGAI